MLNESLKSLRKSKGLTQEELAARLSVARQTVSKWENGLSVPDADALIRVAGILEVSVSELLGSQVKESVGEATIEDVAEQLSRINAQLAIKNRRSGRIWKIIVIVVATVILLNILLIIFSYVGFKSVTSEPIIKSAEVQVIDPEN